MQPRKRSTGTRRYCVLRDGVKGECKWHTNSSTRSSVRSGLPDGLGRVIAFKDKFPEQWIQVGTYIGDRSCKWSPDNVCLVAIHYENRQGNPMEHTWKEHVPA